VKYYFTEHTPWKIIISQGKLAPFNTKNKIVWRIAIFSCKEQKKTEIL